MQEHLPRLTRELRKETCPRRVIDEALRRIAAERPPRGLSRYAIPATLALTGAVLLCGLLVRSRLAGNTAGQQPQWVEQQAQHRRQAARQAEAALGFIGSVVLHAVARSETVISDHALSPLHNGLGTATNNIVRQY